MRTGRAVAVVVVDGRLAVMRRWRREAGHYAVLPGGGIEPGETVDEAVVREAKEELGLDVRPVEVLEVEEHNGQPHTYVRCAVIGGTFGTGTGEEYSAVWPESRGTYEPALVDVTELAAIDIRPAWLVDVAPRWLS